MYYSSYKIGTIIEISEEDKKGYRYITIGTNPDDIYTYMRLVYSDRTLILDCEYKEIDIEDLNIGDRVVAFHSNVMTMSIPPQSNVYIIQVK